MNVYMGKESGKEEHLQGQKCWFESTEEGFQGDFKLQLYWLSDWQQHTEILLIKN